MNVLKSIILACLALSLAGCAGGGSSLFKQPDPVKQYFVLQIQRPIRSCPNDSFGVLKISRLHISPTYSTRELVYRVGAETYATDYYNIFLVQPQDMISEVLLEWFAGSGLFSHVTPLNSPVQPNYLLDSSVTQLYGDYSKPGESRAVLEMQFFLLRDVMAKYQVAFCKDYAASVALQDRKAETLVAGLQKALLSILEQLENDIAAALRPSDAEPGPTS